jgi:calcium binding protein 39
MIANEVYNQDLLAQLVAHLPKLEFEARKDVGHIFNTLLRRTIGSRLPTVELIVNKPEIIFSTLRG